MASEWRTKSDGRLIYNERSSQRASANDDTTRSARCVNCIISGSSHTHYNHRSVGEQCCSQLATVSISPVGFYWTCRQMDQRKRTRLIVGLREKGCLLLLLRCVV